MGNPWLRINEASWASVSPQARQMVADWLKLALMQKFFNLLAEDGRNDPRRLQFWESYRTSIHDMYFALGDDARSHPGPDFKEIRQQMRGLQLTLTDSVANNNAFIMCIGEHVVVEFGLKGNACFIFRRDRLPFPLLGSVAGNSRALKHPSYVERLLHIDSSMGLWEDKFRSTLAKVVNVRPSAHAAGMSSASAPRSETNPSKTSPSKNERDQPAPSGQPRQTDIPGLRGSPGATARKLFPPFSMAEFRSLCSSHRLDWHDNRPKGGNLWVHTKEQGTEVSDTLEAWGFQLKSGAGWWRQ